MDYAKLLRVNTTLKKYLEVKLWEKNLSKITEKSIRSKLLNVAKNEGIYYQTSYSQDFYLKGGALMYAHEKFAARPTLDIDFLGNKFRIW